MLARVLIALVTAVLVGQAPEPSNADWQWLEDHRDPALDALMPFPRQPESLVTYRSYRDLYQNVEERYFSMSARWSGRTRTIEAVVVVPIGGSIQQQLLNLHMRDREMPFDAVLKQVTVRRVVLDEGRCRAVRHQLDALSKTTMSLPKQDVVFIHPVIHRFSILIEGDIDATIYNERNPLVRWATNTLSALSGCTSAAATSESQPSH